MQLYGKIAAIIGEEGLMPRLFESFVMNREKGEIRRWSIPRPIYYGKLRIRVLEWGGEMTFWGPR